MNAKNCELAIARFDSDDENKKWDEHVCFVCGNIFPHHHKSETRLIWWEHKTNSTIMYAASLPKSRVVKAVVKPKSQHLVLNGEFFKLTIDDVEPGATCDKNKETSDVKLGGCYHTGRAYCLGYRRGQGEEIELGRELFTCLKSGIKGGAQAALDQHRKNFDCTTDIPRFIVELEPVKIIDEDDEKYKPKEHCLICEDCGELQVDYGYDDDVGEYCLECGEKDSDCLCYEEDHNGYCHWCGEFCTDCECDDEENYNLTPCDADGYMRNGSHLEGGCMSDSDEFDDENVDQTFRPMNAFARVIRWLKARKRS